MSDYQPGVSVPCTCDNCSNPDDYAKVTFDNLTALINELVPPDPDFWWTCVFVPGFEEVVWGHVGRDYVNVKRVSVPVEFRAKLGVEQSNA